MLPVSPMTYLPCHRLTDRLLQTTWRGGRCPPLPYGKLIPPPAMRGPIECMSVGGGGKGEGNRETDGNRREAGFRVIATAGRSRPGRRLPGTGRAAARPPGLSAFRTTAGVGA